jgi:hypothetical protein
MGADGTETPLRGKGSVIPRRSPRGYGRNGTLMSVFSMRAIAAAIGLLSCAPQTQDAQRRPHATIGEVTSVWSDAIAARDLARIVSFSPPEYREGVTRGLADTRSELFRFLLGESTSVRSLLQSQGTEAWIFPRADLADAGGGTTVCIVSARVAARGRPGNPERLLEDQKKGLAGCVFFFCAEGQWFVNYD